MKTIVSINPSVCLSVRIFSGSLTNRTEMDPSPLSAPPNQASLWRSAPLQRSPRSSQGTVTLRTTLDLKRRCQDWGVACLLLRMHHVGQHLSSLWKIHTTSIATPAPFSPLRSSLSISSTGFIISFSECLLPKLLYLLG